MSSKKHKKTYKNDIKKGAKKPRVTIYNLCAYGMIALN